LKIGSGCGLVAYETVETAGEEIKMKKYVFEFHLLKGFLGILRWLENRFPVSDFSPTLVSRCRNRRKGNSKEKVGFWVSVSERFSLYVSCLQKWKPRERKFE